MREKAAGRIVSMTPKHFAPLPEWVAGFFHAALREGRYGDPRQERALTAGVERADCAEY